MAGLAADLIVLLHFAFIVFVALGGLLVLKWGRAAYLHIPCALWGALIEFYGWICPLTPLEHRLREAAGSESYSGDFIDQYVMPFIYPPGLTRSMQIALALAVIVLNLGVYGWVLARRSKKNRPQGED